MVKHLKRYQWSLLLISINIILFFFTPTIALNSFISVKDSLIEMIYIIPPIFLLLGIMDVWVEKEKVMKYLGKNSGLKGVLVSFFLGAFAAGPLYAAFPLAGVFLKKGSSLFNVLIFIGAWSTTKIPLLLFENASLGYHFTILRLALNIPIIIAIAFILEKLSEHDKVGEI